MKNCKMFIDKLALMALDELSEDETRQVKQHLLECAACAENLKSLEEVTSMLGESPADKLTEVEKLRIENAIYRRLANSTSASPRPSWMNTSLRLAASLALVAIGYTGAVLSFGSQPLQTEPLLGESQLANLDWKENVASFRLSPEGLRLIARGREGLKSN